MHDPLTEPLRLYAVFHLNLAYSSIEEGQRAEVIRRCYWPLLRLAREQELPLGIEAPAFTLEEIERLDPAWIEAFKDALGHGCELVGGGYSQIIGPLVPCEVNAANLRIGNAVYERILGFRPKLALVGEQAYSAGLVPLYLEAGYRAILMEWENAANAHPEWERAWLYRPQAARGQHGEAIPLIWTSSIAFQKLQRFAHGEVELDEYLADLARHVGLGRRAFPLYANDAELFDFRPGRYRTEAPLCGEGEWRRLSRLFEALRTDGRYDLVAPSAVLGLAEEPGAPNALSLESPDQPVPVKKQEKYNLTRWAVTGPEDLAANTACWRIYESLRRDPGATADDWRELCYLWSSDFRTHTTERRLAGFRERLRAFGRRFQPVPRVPERGGPPAPSGARVRWRREGRFLVVEGERARARFNCRRGLCVDALWLGDLCGAPLCGTLPLGYYADMEYATDWYTGHSVFEAPGGPRVTDLSPVEPTVALDARGDAVIRAALGTPFGPVTKEIRVAASEPEVAFSLRYEWPRVPPGSFRIGNVTLNPEAFDRATLFYRTANGGPRPETFALGRGQVAHGEPVSLLISAKDAVGATSGAIDLGDARRALRVEIDKTASALIGLVTSVSVGESWFCRLALSAGEVDETRWVAEREPLECRFRVSLAD